MANDKLLDTIYTCSKEGCFYHARTKYDVERHDKELHGEPKIVSVQKQRGNPESMLEYGVRMGYVPTEGLNYRQRLLCTMDIESLEVDFEGKKEGRDRNIIKAQKLVSLAVGTNIPNMAPRFFCRESSKPEAEEDLIENFLDYLEQLRTEYIKHIPEYVNK